MWYVGKFDEATWQLFGDLLTIRSSVKEVREKSLVLVHEMTNQETEELAARTILTGVCIDLATRKARPVPPDIRERIVSARAARADE